MNLRHVGKKCCHNRIICSNIYFGKHIDKEATFCLTNKGTNAILVDQPLQLDSNASIITFCCRNQSLCVAWTWSVVVLVCFYKFVKLINFVYLIVEQKVLKVNTCLKLKHTLLIR